MKNKARKRLLHPHSRFYGKPWEGERERKIGSYRKVGHVGDKDVHLDHLGDGRPGLLEDRLEVLDAGSGFLLDGPGDKVALNVTGNLP